MNSTRVNNDEIIHKNKIHSKFNLYLQYTFSLLISINFSIQEFHGPFYIFSLIFRSKNYFRCQDQLWKMSDQWKKSMNHLSAIFTLYGTFPVTRCFDLHRTSRWRNLRLKHCWQRLSRDIQWSRNSGLRRKDPCRPFSLRCCPCNTLLQRLPRAYSNPVVC